MQCLCISALICNLAQLFGIHSLGSRAVHLCVVQVNQAVGQLEVEMGSLQDTASLFEVSFPDYKQLHQCRCDIVLLKSVWDLLMFVKVMKAVARAHESRNS